MQGRVLVILTAFRLFAASKTDLMRCPDSQRKAIVTAILYDQFIFVAGTCKDTHANWIDLSVVIFLLCCLAQNATAKLSFTILKTATFLSKPRNPKALLSLSSAYRKQLLSL